MVISRNWAIIFIPVMPNIIIYMRKRLEALALTPGILHGTGARLRYHRAKEFYLTIFTTIPGYGRHWEVVGG
jgi:hypothetical protein